MGTELKEIVIGTYAEVTKSIFFNIIKIINTKFTLKSIEIKI